MAGDDVLAAIEHRSPRVRTYKRPERYGNDLVGGTAAVAVDRPRRQHRRHECVRRPLAADVEPAALRLVLGRQISDELRERDRALFPHVDFGVQRLEVLVRQTHAVWFQRFPQLSLVQNPVHIIVSERLLDTVQHVLAGHPRQVVQIQFYPVTLFDGRFVRRIVFPVLKDNVTTYQLCNALYANG